MGASGRKRMEMERFASLLQEGQVYRQRAVGCLVNIDDRAKISPLQILHMQLLRTFHLIPLFMGQPGQCRLHFRASTLREVVSDHYFLDFVSLADNDRHLV